MRNRAIRWPEIEPGGCSRLWRRCRMSVLWKRKSQVSICVWLSKYLLEGNQEDGGVSHSYLFLREVGNVAGHGCGDDEAAGLPLSEMQTDGSGTVVNTSQIGLNDLIPLLDRSIEDAAVGSTTSVGNEDIDLAEVPDDISHQLLDFFVAADVGLVRLGLDAVLLGELFGILLAALGPGGVGDGDICTKFRAATSGLCADTSGARSTGDDDNLPFEREELVEGGGGGNWNRHFESG